jgi:TctA family transporter
LQGGVSLVAVLIGAFAVAVALVFGIPGDSITPIVIGVLIVKGSTPGPMVFTSSGDLIWAVYLVFILANLLMIPLGLAAIRLGRFLHNQTGFGHHRCAHPSPPSFVCV